MPGDSYSVFFDCGLYIAFILVEDGVAEVLVVEGDFSAIHLSAEIVGIAEDSLGVGVLAWILQL